MSITNGSVTIEDGVKAAEEYAPARKVSVTLAFTTEDNADALNQASDIANAKVTELLGKPAKATPKPRAAAPAAPKPASAKEKTKDDLAAEAGLPNTGGEGLLDETPAKPAVIETTAKADTNELDDLLGDDAPKPVTDAELAAAAQKKNATEKEKNKTWAPAKIRELVVKYAGAGKQLRDIPAAERHKFLADLEKLS